MDIEFIEEAMFKQEPVKIRLINGDILAGWLMYGYNFNSFIQLDTGFKIITIAKNSIDYISYVYK